ncbi:MAG: ATPase domain-containing protein [Burkholderiaceae bacterium]
MTSGKATIHRLATGVGGLDEVLGGGLPEFSFNILAGPPGSGKTTLAHQLMFGLATAERPALYFTVLGEPPLKMLRYMQQFAFFNSAAVNHSVHFINLADDAATGDLNQVLSKIVAAVERYAPAFVFVDSFRSVMLASEASNHSYVGLQKFVQQLGMLMTSWQATTFLLGEYFTDADPNPVFTVADGLIFLRQSALRNSVVRKLEIVKMRGQATLPGMHTFRIGAAGVSVFPPAQNTSHPPAPTAAARASRLGMGVARLDDLMGGGLPRGYSLLVAGPSGSGKTILASAFLSEGARCGETGIIAAFEQRPTLARGRAVQELIAAGKINVVETRSANLSVDEMSMVLITEIRRTGATRIVIDSLSGFELALAPTFQEDFREALARMVPALTSAGATVLMTSELEDRYDDLRFSPYGTAFLTDAIIVQRYIEVDSRLQRVMAVVKVRGSAHSNELRLFQIDDTGICIGEMLADHEGLLGGRPTRRAPTLPVDTDSAPAMQQGLRRMKP